MIERGAVTRSLPDKDDMRFTNVSDMYFILQAPFNGALHAPRVRIGDSERKTIRRAGPLSSPPFTTSENPLEYRVCFAVSWFRKQFINDKPPYPTPLCPPRAQQLTK